MKSLHFCMLAVGILTSSGSYLLSADTKQTTLKATDTNARAMILSHYQAPKQKATENLFLKVSLPKKIPVTDQQVKWSISQQGKPIKKLSGKKQALNIKPGMYKVVMQVGKFRQEKVLRIDPYKIIKPYFRAEVGHLHLVSNQNVDWEISSSQGSRYQMSNTRVVDELVPAGTYQVRALIRDVPLQQNIHIKPGQQINQRINIPVGQVRLMALRDNQPLLKPMLWKIFRLENEGKRQIGSYRRHTKGITVPPGHYEAVAIHRETVRKRRFWVQKGVTNQVVLAMD